MLKIRPIPLLLFLFFLAGFSPGTWAQTSSSPCDCAQRWDAGGAWSPNDCSGGISEAQNPPAGSSSQGIIECGSSANTQSNISANCTYDPAGFLVDLSGQICIDPSSGSPILPQPTGPTAGQPVIWLQFDVRPNAGNFQIQINDNDAADNPAWALYYSTESQSCTDAPGTDGNTFELAGDCSSLVLATCGVESSSTWNTIPVPNFSETTNYYIVLWDQNADGNFDLNNFKARFGCGVTGGGGSDPICVVEETNTTTECGVNGELVVVSQVSGINGTYVATDNTGATGVSYLYTAAGGATNTTGLVLTSITGSGEVTGTVTVMYPAGTTNYDFDVTNTDPNSSPPLEDPNACTITVSGTAAACPVCDVTLVSAVQSPDACVTPANGSIVAIATSSSGTLEFSLDGITWFSGTATANPDEYTYTFTGLGPASYQVRVRDIGVNPVCCDIGSAVVINALPTPISVISGATEYCAGESVTLDAGAGFASYAWSTTATIQTITVTAGIYTVAVTNADGCIGTSAPFTVTEKPTKTGTDAATICSNETYTFGTQTLSTGGIHTETFTAANGCDSVVTLTLTVNPTKTGTDAATICSNETYTFGSQTLSTGGIYDETFTAANGCDSVVTLTLTVNPTKTGTDAATICSNETYTFGTQTISTAGIHTETFTSAAGCDSVVTLTLTVNPTKTGTDAATICSNETYTFGTQTLSTGGTHTETFTSAAGCDSVVTLTLTVNPTKTGTDAATICSNETYTFGTQTLSTGGTHTETFTSAAGCDSVVTLTLTVNPTKTGTDAATICSNETYTFGTQTLSTGGTHTETFTSAAGCDSVVTLTLTVNPTKTGTDAATICSNETYTFGTQTLSTGGTHTETFTSAAGCDSVVTLTLTVNPTKTGTDAATICSNETYTFGTQTLSTGGTHTETFTSAAGCDSVVTLTLTVNPTKTGTDAATICSNETYTFGTQTLSTGGTHTETFTSAAGCDSVVTLTLTVNSTKTGTDAATICSNETYTFGTQTLSTGGTHTETFTSAAGCDSVVTLTLTVNPTKTGTDAATICSNETYTFGTQTLSTGGTHTETFTSAAGCDSVVTLTLTVNPTKTGTDAATICSNETYTFGTQTLSTGGTHTETFTSAAGCDSVVTLTLTINPIYNVTDAITLCASALPYTFGTQSLTAAGVFTETFQSALGCDSTVTLTLTIDPVIQTNDAVTLCDDQTPYVFGTQSLSTTGVYTETFNSSVGCDSVVTLTLTVNPTKTGTDAATICSNETYIFGTQTLSTGGTYDETFQTTAGCDSVVTLTLTVNPTKTGTDAATICSNETYTFGTQTLSTGGTHTETFTSAAGCDSVVTLTLTVNPTKTGTDAATICSNETYTFGTQTISTGGTHTETFTSAAGCDSVVTLTLTVNPTKTGTDAATICSNETYTFGTQTISTGGTHTETFTSAAGCDSVVTLTLTVNPTKTGTDAATICSNETYTFGTQTLSTGGTHTETFTSAAGCDSVVTLTLTVNPTKTGTDAATICSNETYTFGTQTLSTGGIHTETFTSAAGCDSVVTLTLTVNPTKTGTDAATICSNETYTFGTQTLSTGGTHTETFTSAAGCDSVVTLTLTINPIYNVTDAITLCASALPYTFGTQSLTAAGVFTETFQSALGCDSTVTLTLTIDPVIQTNDAVTLCDDQTPYVFGAQSLSTTGVFTETFVSSVGCDSVVTLTLTVNPTKTGTDAATICSNETYTFGTQTLSTGGTYDETFQTAAGCDSVVTLTLTVNPTKTGTDAATICSNETYTFGTQTLSTGGTHTETFTSAAGCDSVVTLTLTVNPTKTGTDAATICSNETYTFGTQTISTGGTHTETFTSAAGCDSVVTLTLTVNPTKTGTDAATICSNETYTFGTQTISTGGTHTETFTSAAGCDSVVTLTLTVNPTKTGTDAATICSNETYTFGTQTISTGGTHTETFTSAAGCDSVVTLTLTVNPTKTGTDAVTICEDQLPYLFGSQTLTTAGNYDETFTSAAGCDSIVSLTLSVDQLPILTALTPELCQSNAASVDLTTYQSQITSSAGTFTWSKAGATISELFISEYIEGSSFNKYIEVYNGTGGAIDLADYELHLFSNGNSSPNTTNTLSGSLADGSVIVYANSSASAYGGATTDASAVGYNGDDAIGLYNSVSGVYVDIVGHIGQDPGSAWTQGGNSTQNQTLVRNTSVTVGLSSSTVDFPELGTEWTSSSTDDVSNLGSHTVNAGGTIVIVDPTDVAIVDGEIITATVTNGVCSASTTLTFSVVATKTGTDAAAICDGDNYLFGTQTLTVGGTFMETFTSAAGCDSIVTLTLTVNPNKTGTDAAAICDGDSYVFGTQTLTTGGTFTEAFNTAAGCDSVVTLTLTVNPNKTGTDAASICEGDSYVFGTQTLTAGGTFTENFTSAAGCDSVVTLTLTVDQLPLLTALTPEVCQSAAANVDLTTYQSQITTSAGTFSWSRAASGGITELFISEYIEGSSFNKYIEVYNGTGGTIDLADYELRLFSNGNSSPNTTNTLSGSLADGSVIVYANSSATAYGGTTTNASAVGYNGDDAIGLYNTVSGTYVDIVGHIGQDPGSAWSQGGNSTANQTLVRNASISVGLSSSTMDFPELGTEWTSSSTDDVSNLGSHTANAASPMAITDPTDVAIVGGDIINATVTNGTCSVSTTLTFSVVATKTGTDAAAICDGDNYLFGTQTLTVGGTFMETFTSAAGCDSIVTLTLTVNPTKTGTDAATICSNETYTFGTQTLSTGGTHTETFTSAAGCDSVVTLTLTVNPTKTGTDAATICSNETYTFGTQTLSTGGTHTETFTSAAGCDSVVTLTLTVNPTKTGTDAATICSNETYTFGTQTISTGGTHTETFTSAAGCDSVVTLTLTVNPTKTGTDAATICSNETYTFGTQTLSTGGTHTEIFTSAAGCDSVVTLTLTVNPIYNVTDAITLCASALPYTFGTQSLTAAGVFTETFQSALGCDSTVTLTLTIDPVIQTNDAVTLCDDQTPYVFGTQSLSTTGVFTETFVSSVGCDSVVTLTLTVNPTYNLTDTKAICAGDSYVFGTQTLTMAGSYTETFQSSAGCDSVVMLTLTINPTNTTNLSATTCDPAQVGITQQVLTNQFTCDSLVITTTTLLPSNTTNVAATTCDPAQVGITQQVLTNQFTCDSLVITTTTLLPSNTTNVAATTCDPAQVGITQQVLTNQFTCDSLVITTTTLLPSQNVTDAVTLCDDQTPYAFGTQSLSTTGVYTETFVNAAGCDSVVTLTLTVNPTYNLTDAITLCASALPYTFGTQSLTAAGVYTETFQSTLGCDSTVTLTLSIDPSILTGESLTLCDDQTPYAFGTQSLSTTGVYMETFTSSVGCDSIVTLTLTVNPTKTKAVLESVCANDLPFAFGTQMLSTTGVYTETFQTTAGCDSVVTLSLTVDPTATAGANSTQTVCEGDIIDLTTLVTVAGGTFLDPSASGGLSGTQFNTAGLIGVYPIVYTVSSGNSCPDAAAVITIIVQESFDRLCVANNWGDDVPISYIPNIATYNHAVYLYDFPDGSGGTLEPRFLWETTGSFKYFNDGTGTLTGTVVNATNPNIKFDVSFLVENRLDWTDWSALGRGYKDDSPHNNVAVTEHINWDYFEVSSASTLTGSAGSVYAGDVLSLTHDPVDFSLGGQLGIGANDKDDTYGFSAWFGWSGTLAGMAYTSHGDVNIDLDCNESPCSQYPSAAVVVAPRVILEGPFDMADSRMSDDLRTLNYIPSTEPYTALGYTVVGNGGGETVSALSLSVTGDNAIVDWIWVELRDANDPTIVVAARAALIQRDGDIVGSDGSSAVSFAGVNTGNYYFVVKHRNHLGVMTQTPISLTGSATNINFADGTTSTYGTNAQNSIGSTGHFCMISANVTGDKVVDAADRSELWNERSTIGYKLSDATCDGATDAADRSAGWNNRNRVEQIPD